LLSGVRRCGGTRSITSAYDIEGAFCEVYAAFANTVPLGANRGSGRAEAIFLVERLIDRYARAIGMDRVEVRRTNLIAPDKFPFDNCMDWLYDSGNYAAALNRVVELVDYANIEARKAEARQRGKRLGVGIACYVAVCGVGPSPRRSKEGMLGGTWESANVRVHPTGEVSLTVGSKPHGQAHETTFAQILAEELEIDPGLIEVLHSDTKGVPFGQGTYGSRSLSVAGPAIQAAARKILDKARKTAAHFLQAAEEDLVYQERRLLRPGRASVVQDAPGSLPGPLVRLGPPAGDGDLPRCHQLRRSARFQLPLRRARRRGRS
jgi:aerobic carbon-monoxide dehydrogenase large subunit